MQSGLDNSAGFIATANDAPAPAEPALFEPVLAARQAEARLRSGRLHDELVTRLSQESDLGEGLIRFRANLLALLPAKGVALWLHGQCVTLGETPAVSDLAMLIPWLEATPHKDVFRSDELARIYPPASAFAGISNAVLGFRLSAAPSDYILWFRQFGTRPGPEPSQRPWQPIDIEAVERLRASLGGVVQRRIEGIARERRSARLLQEQLMRQVDIGLHRSKDVHQTLQEETRRRVAVEADLSQLLRRTVEDQEAERLRIARELHDTLGQTLTLLQLGVDDIGRCTADNVAAQARVADLKSLATDLGRQVRRLAWEIRPPALDDIGIEGAIRHLLEVWSEKSRVGFELHIALGDSRLPAAVETTLYRVLQEALTNIVRHAAAKHVGIILRRGPDELTMIVEDDGCGFADPEASPPRERLGLLGIRERLSLVGGTLEIESAPNKGTALFARIPL